MSFCTAYISMKNKIGGICPHCNSFKYCRNACNGVKACINFNKFPKEVKDERPRNG